MWCLFLADLSWNAFPQECIFLLYQAILYAPFSMSGVSYILRAVVNMSWPEHTNFAQEALRVEPKW